ncbi:MAG: alpha/beta fold hydrolase [Myxococcaceae bacterium]
MPLRLFRVPALRFEPDQLYRVPTADGSAIALGRYHPRGPRRFEEPVLLAHSLGTNRFNLDFDETYSLARFLARRGFEAWVLEVRGHGLGGSALGATFDTEVEHDVTAALTAILSTGAQSVSWVGHSRGGLLAYAHLAKNPTAPISAIATLGSPLSFDAQPGVVRFLAAVEPTLQLPLLPLSLGGKAWPLGLPPDPVGKYLLNAEHVDPVVVRQAIQFVAADIAGGVARQFARWVRHGTFDSESGFDYRAGMKAVRTPVLAIAGARDFLVPPSASHLVQNLTSGPVETVLAGKAGGFSVDFGHGDLALGRTAPTELFPRIAEFLARHSAKR